MLTHVRLKIPSNRSRRFLRITSFLRRGCRSGHALTYTGNSLSAPVVLGLAEQPFPSVSCASSSSCLVTDDAGQIVVYNGHSWSAPTTIDSGGGLMHVACPSTRFSWPSMPRAKR